MESTQGQWVSRKDPNICNSLSPSTSMQTSLINHSSFPLPLGLRILLQVAIRNLLELACKVEPMCHPWVEKQGQILPKLSLDIHGKTTAEQGLTSRPQRIYSCPRAFIPLTQIMIKSKMEIESMFMLHILLKNILFTY